MPWFVRPVIIMSTHAYFYDFTNFDDPAALFLILLTLLILLIYTDPTHDKF